MEYKADEFAFLCNDLLRYYEKIENAKKEYAITKSRFDLLNIKNLEFIASEINKKIADYFNLRSDDNVKSIKAKLKLGLPLTKSEKTYLFMIKEKY